MKLEFGCRELPVEGYTHVDLIKGEDIELIGDIAKALPFKDNSIEEIFNSHLIEHIPWYNTVEVLKEWYRVLKPEGVLETWTLDFEKIAREYLNKNWTPNGKFMHENPEKIKQRWVNCRIFWKDYENNPAEWHKACFDFEYLKWCMEKAGFTNISRITTKSKGFDHGFLNMGVRGVKPHDLKLSVVMGVRNRVGFRLKNCIKSLLSQSLPRPAYEIIVVDYGGQDNLKEFLKEIDPTIRYIHTNEKGKFNEARAKNIGVKNAKSENVLCTNADILFGKNALIEIFWALKAEGDKLIECQRYDFSKDLVETHKEGLNLELAIKKEGAALHNKDAVGDCQAFKKKFFVERLQGFDEYFEGWGELDRDLERRALEAGAKIVWLEDKVVIAHQNHPQTYVTNEEVTRNKKRYHAPYSIEANQGKTWGEIKPSFKTFLSGLLGDKK